MANTHGNLPKISRLERLRQYQTVGGEGKNQLKRFSMKHQEVLRLLSTGMKNVDVAKIVGLSPDAVSRTRNCYLGMEEGDRLTELREDAMTDVYTKMALAADKVVDYYVDAMDETTTTGKLFANKLSLKLKISESILDRDGRLKKITSNETVVAHATLKDIQEIRARKSEKAKDIKQVEHSQ